MAVPLWFKRILSHYGVPFEELHHPPVFSASRLAGIEHTPGRRVAKTVFLTSGKRPVAVVMPATARLDLERARAVLNQGDLRLATEAEIAGWFKGSRPGTVPPLRLRSDECIVMDRSLAQLGRMVMPAGTAEDAVSVRFRDWYRMVRPGVGRFARPENGRAETWTAPRILVVEDETVTNQLLCQLLERSGFACLSVEEGERALAMASEIKPSAILLDLMLPDISGFEVYERLRRSGPIRSPAVIVVTALADDSSRQRGRLLGADAYLTKPFRPEALVAELHLALADSDL